MKKFQFITLLVITMAFSITMTVQAEDDFVRTGKWIDVYQGGSMPSGAVCAYSAFRSQCVEGDSKSYFKKNKEVDDETGGGN